MTETESAILAHARRCAPAESCGFVVKTPEGERYFPCVNISGEPEEYFRMSPEDWLRRGENAGGGKIFSLREYLR
ncbi:hydrolase [Escherichia coli]|nr:Mov34/MPN/PAD-1 family protein [Escherichia coli]OUK48300.1 hydrolase [Escherichia coli]